MKRKLHQSKLFFTLSLVTSFFFTNGNNVFARNVIVPKIASTIILPKTPPAILSNKDFIPSNKVSSTAFTTTVTTFPAGCYIIDMGQATQTVNNGLKPYGLVYALIAAGIPVNWAIEPTKIKDGTDFIASSAGNLNKAYKGGSFIINTVAYPAAITIINSWKTNNAGLVVDGPTIAAFNAPIYTTLTIWPNAFLDDDNDAKITPYYANAGIPDGTYHINSDPTDLPQCGSANGTQDVYILPHADPQDWDPTWVNYLQNFINNGGAMWAGCHAVSAMENIPGCNFLSSTGAVLWTDHDSNAASKIGTPPYTYNNPAHPIMQFIGKFDGATANGSESIYLPKTTWLPTTTVSVYDPDYINYEPNPDVSYLYPANPAGTVVFGPAYGTIGLIMYEAGHSLENGTIAEEVAAQRAFFNFLLLVGTQPQNSLYPPNVPNQTTTICNGLTFSVTPAGIPANVKYTWTIPTGTGFTGGSAQTTPQSSISQTLTNTTVNPVTATYIVTPRIGACIGNPFTLTVTVYPPTAMAVTSSMSSICIGNSTTLTASGAVTYNWTPATGLNTTTGATVIASPTVTTTYTVFDPVNNSFGCSNAKTITVYVNTPTIIAGASPNPLCVGTTLNLTSSNVIPSGIILSENFNAATNNWTTINNSTGGTPANAAWTLRPSEYKINCSGDGTKLISNDASQFYLSNSCAQGNGGTTQTILQSPVMSTVGFSSLSLNFYHYFKFFTGASAKVEVSTNGTVWVEVANYNSATIGAGNAFAQQVINLSPYTGNAIFYIRFKYDAPWSWYWAIDNVTVSGTANSPISWSGPAGFTSTVQNPIIPNVTAANAGIYTLTYTDPVGGCSATATVNVVVNPLPTIGVTASPTSFCIGSSTTLTATGAVTYSWSPNTGLSATAGDTVIADPLTTTTYTVTGTNSNGCINTNTIEVVVNSIPTISITPASALICTSIGTPLTASGAATYTWSPATGLSATTGATVTASPSTPTTYTVTGVSLGGCISTQSVFVDVIPSPPTTGVTICPGGSGELTSTASCPPGNSITVGPLYSGNAATIATIDPNSFAWNIPTNALLNNDNIFATVGFSGAGVKNSQYLSGTNYGFTIPSEATIIGISASIGRYQNDTGGGNDIKDFELNLLKGGTVYGSNYADPGEWPKRETEKIYGGTSDTWGASWTPADINNTNFGVSLRVNSSNNRTGYVDYMRIAVTYTIPGVLNWFTVVSGGTSIGTGSPFNPVGVLNSGLPNTNTPGTYTFYAECSSDTRCRTTTTFIITPNVATPVFSLGATSSRCQGAASVTYSATASNSTGISYSLDATSITGGNSIVAGTGVVTFVAGWSGTSIVTATATGCNGPTSASHTITINPTPATPIVGTITQPVDCKSPPGSVLLTNLPSGGILNPGNIAYSGTSHTVTSLTGGTYNFTVTVGSCTSLASANVVINPIPENTWRITGWSSGAPPTNGTEKIIFDYPFTSTANLYGCSCQVNSGITVSINSGHSLTLTNEITVASSGNITFENNASLVQIDNVSTNNNTGEINYKRNGWIRRFDYIYFTSPVENQVVNAITQAPYVSGPIYKWNPTIANPNGGQGNWENANGNIMETARGYTVRSPDNFPTTNTTFYGLFRGKPNNGIITIPVSRGSMIDITPPYIGNNGTLIYGHNDNWNLIGNPYPSSIRGSQFLFDNQTKIEGNIRIWTHATLPSQSQAQPFYGSFGYNYTPNDYLSYSFTGTSCCPLAPDEIYIGAGQGFFVQMIDGPATTDFVTFNNNLRSASYNNSFFFRNANPSTATNTNVPFDVNNIKRNRIWLDLVNSSNQSSRILIGNIEGATNGKDNLFDANAEISGSFTFYSLIGFNKFFIQGRALPFDITDEVPLGIKVPTAGNYAIAIAAVDGDFVEKKVFVKDMLLNIVHNLKITPYQFTSAAGQFDNRFKIVYHNATTSNRIYEYENSVKVIANEVIEVQSTNESIETIMVYDLLGRTLGTYNTINSKEFTITNLIKNNTTLLLKVRLQNGDIVNEKIIY